MRRRFLVDGFEEKAAVLTGDAAHHLGQVLRAEPGQQYELSDGRSVWLARVERVTRDRIDFALVEPLPAREPLLHIALYISIVKFDRFEWCLEKATELGVSEIIPLAAARSEKGLLAAAPKRAARWARILMESAQQSRRVRAPLLHPVGRPAEAFTAFGAFPPGAQSTPVLRVLLSERENATPIREVLADSPGSAGAALAIGPEGGWTDEEFSAAAEAGYREVSLCSQILRTETAVIAALAILNYALGDSP
jgi:16S rRNA (uracil1498-N3)-methyltransferase